AAVVAVGAVVRVLACEVVGHLAGHVEPLLTQFVPHRVAQLGVQTTDVRLGLVAGGAVPRDRVVGVLDDLDGPRLVEIGRRDVQDAVTGRLDPLERGEGVAAEFGRVVGELGGGPFDAAAVDGDVSDVGVPGTRGPLVV